jgi:hypothetical protein
MKTLNLGQYLAISCLAAFTFLGVAHFGQELVGSELRWGVPTEVQRF